MSESDEGRPVRPDEERDRDGCCASNGVRSLTLGDFPGLADLRVAAPPLPDPLDVVATVLGTGRLMFVVEMPAAVAVLRLPTGA